MSLRIAGARRFAPAMLALAAVLAAPAGTGAEDTPTPAREPRAVVEDLHAALLRVMRNARELGYPGRRSELAPVITASFDLPLMARKAAGRHWKKLGEEDRRRFVATFSRLAVANYAGRFDGYSGERFETSSQEPAEHDTALVRTRLVKSDGDSVRLDYRLRPAGASWRIFDVFLDGTVSELALRRSEYSSVIRREGFEALLRALETKIADQEKGSS